MKLRDLSVVLTLAVLSTLGLRAQNGQVSYWPHDPGTTHEKLYVNSQGALINNLTIIDVPTLKVIKKMTIGAEPHGVASPKSQDVLYISSMHDGTVQKIDTVKDEIVKVWGGFGVEPEENDITPDGRFLYQPSYAGYWSVFDT